ncbi:MAG: agmatinase [Gemmatimonadota bacterium]|nr:agmatinase [Gemmatimonadota bacterium]
MNEFRVGGRAGGPTARLDKLPWAPGENFLGLPEEHARFEDVGVVILPVPYEATVSYMGGTRFGPRGLLHASRFVELYDHELDAEPYTIGVHTLPELMLTGAGPGKAMRELRRAFDALLGSGKFVIMLGGEHSVSGPPILAHADRLERGKLSVLQLDAHADLRAEYEGTPYSHACVMHTVHERVKLVQVGIRSLTAEERALQRKRRMTVVFGHELDQPDWEDRVMRALGRDVYITVDVDYFDPSIMPATGTPEPGGGAWNPTIRLLDRVFRERNVVGADVVELAPLPGMVAPDFLAAKLVYKLIGFHARGRGR